MMSFDDPESALPVPTGGMTSGTSGSKSDSTSAFLSILKPSVWVTYLQSLFDISTDDVKQRLTLSFLPYKLIAATEQPSLATKPDMYGPFWIATTAVIFMTASANYEKVISSSGEYVYADYSLTWTAAALLYGCLAAVPVAVYSIGWITGLASQGSTIDYKHIMCVYGYSNAPVLPVSILCALPLGIVQKIFLLVGFVTSAMFIYGNLWRPLETLPDRLRLIVVVSSLACQAITYLTFEIAFL